MDKSKQLLVSVQDVLQKEAKGIEDLIHSIDADALEKLIGLLEDCKGKIITTGCGTSGTAARKIAHTLNCIECPAFFLSPSEALHGGLGVVQSEDIVIFFSKGGHTEELEIMADACMKKNATVIAVTEAADCSLAKKSGLLFQIKTEKEPDAFNMLATASTLNVIAVFDAVAITIANRKGYKKEQFLLIHPGGAVGERLVMQVQMD